MYLFGFSNILDKVLITTGIQEKEFEGDPDTHELFCMIDNERLYNAKLNWRTKAPHRERTKLPYVYSAAGATIGNHHFAICGGISKNKSANTDKFCRIYEFQHLGSNDFPKMVKKHETLKLRRHPCGIALDEDKFFVVGGEDANCYNYVNSSSEIITIDSVISGPDLPFYISYHSMILFDENTIFLIGGHQSEGSGPERRIETSNKTWILNPKNDFSICEGPALKIGRRGHSCAILKRDGKTFILVAGGEDIDNKVLDSVEMLDPLSNEGWFEGLKLPQAQKDFPMTSGPCRKSITAYGGVREKWVYEAFYELRDDSLDMGDLGNELYWGTYGYNEGMNHRHSHLALPIPIDVISKTLDPDFKGDIDPDEWQPYSDMSSDSDDSDSDDSDDASQIGFSDFDDYEDEKTKDESEEDESDEDSSEDSSEESGEENEDEKIIIAAAISAVLSSSEDDSSTTDEET